MDLHKEANLSLGNHIKIFSARELKRYNLSKDHSVFGPIHHLPMYILESIGLATIELANHIMATSDISPYHSFPPRPLQPTADQAPQPKPKRVKSLTIKKTPANIVIKGESASKKRKAKTAESSPQVQQSPSKAHDSPVNVVDHSFNEPSESGNVFRRKKLKLIPSHGQIQTKANAGVSQKTPVVVQVPADSPKRTQSYHSVQ